jgi:hypothetical protein
MHETIIHQLGQASDGFWVTRNDKISEKCLNRSREMNSHRIGIVLGIDHLYAIRANLKTSGFVVSYGKLVKAHENMVSTAVVRRWNKNLLALKEIRASSEAKVAEIDESARISQLTDFIQHPW